ncbi:MAG: hypothetical protein LBU32_33365 [Clostridiales bacterium]|nr:hypothetical protein [Clostridiales bacterium]
MKRIPDGQVEAPAGGFSYKTELPTRQNSCAAAYMDSLASAAYWEAIAEEGRIGEYNRKLRITDKSQLISILPDNFICLLRIATSRLAGEAVKIIR